MDPTTAFVELIQGPDEAIPLLRQRLAIDNQRPVVEAELRAAQAAAGQGAPAPTPKPAKPNKHGFKGGPNGKGPPGQLKKYGKGGGEGGD